MLVAQKEAERLLRRYRIPVAESRIYRTKEEAVHTSMPFPLVLKLISPEIVHKSDTGAVVTGIANRTALARALALAESRTRKQGICASFMLQRQEAGREIIVGMKRDAQFGPVIMYGMGGIFVEVYRDVSFRVAPLTMKDIREMVAETKSFQVLKGMRGQAPANIPALTNVIYGLSRLSCENPQFTEIDFNPVMVSEKKAVVVDARLIK